MTPGKAICPMCNGSGEVDEAVVEEYADAFGNDN